MEHTDWPIISLFRSDEVFNLAILNQPLPSNAILHTVWENCPPSPCPFSTGYLLTNPAHIRVAADGGANRLYDRMKQSAGLGLGEPPTDHPFVGLLPAAIATSSPLTPRREPSQL